MFLFPLLRWALMEVYMLLYTILRNTIAAVARNSTRTSESLLSHRSNHRNERAEFQEKECNCSSLFRSRSCWMIVQAPVHCSRKRKNKKRKRKNKATGYLPRFLRHRLTEKSKNRDNAVNLVTLWREKESWDLCSELLHLATNFFRNYITIDPRRYYIVLLLILIFETNFTRAGIKHKFLS